MTLLQNEMIRVHENALRHGLTADEVMYAWETRSISYLIVIYLSKGNHVSKSSTRTKKETQLAIS